MQMQRCANVCTWGIGMPFSPFSTYLLEKEVAAHEYVAGGNFEYVEVDWNVWGDFTEVVVE